MTRSVLPRQVPQDAVVDRRLENLERRSPIASLGQRAFSEVIFSQAGLVLQESGRYYPPFKALVFGMSLSLAVAGTTSTTVRLKVDGGVQGTLTLGAGVNFVSGSFNASLGANLDYLTVETTAIGNGASRLVAAVQLWR